MKTLMIFLFAVASLSAQRTDNPIELGKVEWLRNYDQAIAQSKATDKPIFLLFQEVPGCANCTKYGKDILSHPLMVEAIETEFVPLAIFNNKTGKDREVLVQFGEPSWNNPVVRIIDNEGNDLAKRVGNFRSKTKIVNTMMDVLQKRNNSIPTYLQLLSEEWIGLETTGEEGFLSMYCFWTGEREIAKIDGVLSTEAGFMHGREVVKVAYDETKTDLAKIGEQASKVSCADAIFTDQAVNTAIPTKKEGKYRKDGQDKYYLRHTDYQYIPLTVIQQTKINSALGSKQNPSKYLSPRQSELLASLKSKNIQLDKDFAQAWWDMVL
jgi:copper chaperone CopZ